MGTVIDSLFSVLMGWVRTLVSGIWALFSSERTTALEFLGKNWMAIALLMIAAGLVVDWLVWLIRWQPYHVWAMRVRRLLRIQPPQEDEEEADERYDRYAPEAYEPPAMEPDAQEELPLWLPLDQPVIDEEEAQQVIHDAEQVPDETLGQYPGMRYDGAASQEDMSGTRRFGAVHAEGPGAAEVQRRRAEIDAWQAQMQEEARQRAQAERAARKAEQERRAREIYEAEQARLAREEYEAEQARLAQEMYEAEQARLAQEEYQRQLEEYERQKAQYELELAQYERQKAEYEAAMERARQEELAATRRMSAVQEAEAAQEIVPSRRRRRSVTYSDYVEGETVEELPAPPAWTQMPDTAAAAQQEPNKTEKKRILHLGVNRIAQMMEPDHEDVIGITALPPRVDVHTAYRPAKKPPKGT